MSAVALPDRGDFAGAGEVLGRLDDFLAAYEEMRALHLAPGRAKDAQTLLLEPIDRLEAKVDEIARWVESIDRRFAALEARLAARGNGGDDAPPAPDEPA